MISKFDRLVLVVLAIGLTMGIMGWHYWRSFAHEPQLVAQRIELGNPAGSFDPKQTLGEFHGQQVVAKEVTEPTQTQVLGLSDIEKKIEVDLTNQRLYAFENGRKVYDFLISSGKWDRTPTGTFRIWSKFRYTKMSGGSKSNGTYYYLPNVPYVMFFENNQVPGSMGYSLHGTYWHSNFGTPMSHGCVNMKTEEAAIIYYWSQPSAEGKKPVRASQENPGTEITIYGKMPRN